MALFLPIIAGLGGGNVDPKNIDQARDQLAAAVVTKLRTCESSLPVNDKQDPDYKLIQCWADWWFRASIKAEGKTERPDVCASIVGPFLWQETCAPKPTTPATFPMKPGGRDLVIQGSGGLGVALLLALAAVGIFYATLNIKPGPEPVRRANPSTWRRRNPDMGPRLVQTLTLDDLALAVVDVTRTNDRHQPLKIWLNNEPYLTTIPRRRCVSRSSSRKILSSRAASSR
jgi:hypothetical protein